MDKSQRFDVISIMRVLAMMMIICYHCMCFYCGVWMTFNAINIPFWSKIAILFQSIDLNMFVFISGYLYGYLYIFKNKYRHPLEVIHNKSIRLLLPYCFWGVVMVLAFPWNTWSKLLYGITHLWFLLMLFGVFTLIVILQLLNAHRIRLTRNNGLLLIIVGYLLWYMFSKYVNPDDFLCATKVLYYFPAFIVGCLCAKLRVGRWMPHKAYYLLSVALLVLVASIWYPFPILHGTELIRTVCSYTICVCLLIILSRVSLTGMIRTVIFEVERLSMGTYIFNQIAMNLVFLMPVLHRWFETHWMVGPFVLFPIGFFPPLLLSYLFNKYKVLRWTVGG